MRQEDRAGNCLVVKRTTSKDFIVKVEVEVEV